MTNSISPTDDRRWCVECRSGHGPNECHAGEPRPPIFEMKGREAAFDEPEEERYIATIHVELSHKPSYAPSEGDLHCVAERAVVGAAHAYNLYSTRIVSVALVKVKRRKG